MLGWQLQQLFTAAGRPAKHFPGAPARAKPVFYRRLQSKHFRPTARLGFEILKLVSSDVPRHSVSELAFTPFSTLSESLQCLSLWEDTRDPTQPPLKSAIIPSDFYLKRQYFTLWEGQFPPSKKWRKKGFALTPAWSWSDSSAEVLLQPCFSFKCYNNQENPAIISRNEVIFKWWNCA